MVIGKQHTDNIPIKAHLFNVNQDDMNLDSSAFFFGVVGSGKTQDLVSTALAYYDKRKTKIVDCWGGLREEQYFYALPSRHTKYWDAVVKKFHLTSRPEKAYKVRFLYPMWKGTVGREIPKKLMYKEIIGEEGEKNILVESQIFTIDVNKVTPEMIGAGYGTVKNVNRNLWAGAVRKLKSNSSSPMFFYYMTQKGEKLPFVDFVKVMTDNYLLQGGNAPSNINIEEEIDDYETITCLCTEHLPKEYRFFVTAYFMKNAEKYISRQKGRRTIFIMREVSEFFREVDSSVVQENVKNFKTIIKSVIQMGRVGASVFMDTQSPREVGGLLEGSEAYKVLCKLPEKDIDYTLGKDTDKVSLTLRKFIPKLDKGQLIFVPRKGMASLRYCMLPRCHHWSTGDGVMYEEDGDWARFENTWVRSELMINPIKEFSEIELEKSKELLKKRRQKRKIDDDDDEELEDNYDEDTEEENYSDEMKKEKDFELAEENTD